MLPSALLSAHTHVCFTHIHPLLPTGNRMHRIRSISVPDSFLQQYFNELTLKSETFSSYVTTKYGGCVVSAAKLSTFGLILMLTALYLVLFWQRL